MTSPFIDGFFRATIEEEVGGGIFNAKGKLEKYSNNLPELLLDPSDTPMLEQYIPDLFPELIGYEQALKFLQENHEEELYIDHIFRPALYGKEGYVDLRVKPYHNGWAIIVQDTTERGMLEQKIVQQRNELELLSTKLIAANHKIGRLLRKFVPSTVVDEMMTEGTTKLGGKRQLVTVLFADLRGYTAWAETVDPGKAIVILNTLLTTAATILNKYDATINQLMGDGFMTIFNAPKKQPRHAELALASAREIANIPDVGQFMQFGVGVNTGIAMVGYVGSPKAMDFSAIGTTTNVAYRFQQLAGPGEAIFGEKTRELAGKEFPHTQFGSHKIKGIREPIATYKILP